MLLARVRAARARAGERRRARRARVPSLCLSAGRVSSPLADGSRAPRHTGRVVGPPRHDGAAKRRLLRLVRRRAARRRAPLLGAARAVNGLGAYLPARGRRRARRPRRRRARRAPPAARAARRRGRGARRPRSPTRPRSARRSPRSSGCSARFRLYMVPHALYKLHPAFDDVLVDLLARPARVPAAPQRPRPARRWSKMLASRMALKMRGGGARAAVGARALLQRGRRGHARAYRASTSCSTRSAGGDVLVAPGVRVGAPS